VRVGAQRTVGSHTALKVRFCLVPEEGSHPICTGRYPGYKRSSIGKCWSGQVSLLPNRPRTWRSNFQPPRSGRLRVFLVQEEGSHPIHAWAATPAISGHIMWNILVRLRLPLPQRARQLPIIPVHAESCLALEVLYSGCDRLVIG